MDERPHRQLRPRALSRRRKPSGDPYAMRTAMIAAILISSPAFALTAPNCQLAYKANGFGQTDPSTASLVKRPSAVAGVPGKVSTLFVGDGVVNTVTAAAEDEGAGRTKLTISVDLANGSMNEENTFFINTFADYRGQRVS